jgi:hypothetical protein
VDYSLVIPGALSRSVQDFLSEAAGAVVLENGAVAFDLGPSKYSNSGGYNKFLLHAALRIFRRPRIVVREAAALSGGAGIPRASSDGWLLRSIPPEIDGEFVGVDEHWREGVKVVFRKRPGARSLQAEAETRKSDEIPFTAAI